MSPKSEDQQHRPRAGWIDRRDGTRTPLRFVPTEDPKVFLAVTIDGERAVAAPDEPMRVDVLGPGQTIRLYVGPL